MLVRFAVLCDYSNETSDGKLNLFGLTEAVFAHKFPAIHKHCHLIVSFLIEPDDIGNQLAVEVRFTDADGKSLMEIRGSVSCSKAHTIVNHRHIIHDLQLSVPGPYQFSIRIEGREVATQTLEAVLVSPAPNG